MYLAPSSTIVLLVAAGLAALAGALMENRAQLAVGMATALLLLVGSIFSMKDNPGLGNIAVASYHINYLALRRQSGRLRSGVHRIEGTLEFTCDGGAAPGKAAAGSSKAAYEAIEPEGPQPRLADLATLAFVASLVFMSLEMVAGRLVQRYLGSSIYGWTSVIGVLLAGLSLGNFLGGKIADFVKNEKHASWLFLAASVVTLIVIPLDTQPEFLSDMLWGGKGDSVLQQATELSELSFGPVSIALSWPYRILFLVTLVFFLPAVSMGTVSPVVAKLAVDRLKKLQANRDRDRRGVCLGNGRQHPGHVSDRVFLDRLPGHQGGDPACWER